MLAEALTVISVHPGICDVACEQAERDMTAAAVADKLRSSETEKRADGRTAAQKCEGINLQRGTVDARNREGAHICINCWHYGAFFIAFQLVFVQCSYAAVALVDARPSQQARRRFAAVFFFFS